MVQEKRKKKEKKEWNLIFGVSYVTCARANLRYTTIPMHIPSESFISIPSKALQCIEQRANTCIPIPIHCLSQIGDNAHCYGLKGVVSLFSQLVGPTSCGFYQFVRGRKHTPTFPSIYIICNSVILWWDYLVEIKKKFIKIVKKIS